jgi:hypothetical protein
LCLAAERDLRIEIALAYGLPLAYSDAFTDFELAWFRRPIEN